MKINLDVIEVEVSGVGVIVKKEYSEKEKTDQAEEPNDQVG